MSFIDRAANGVGSAIDRGANWIAEQAETPEIKAKRLDGVKYAQSIKCAAIAAMIVSLSVVLFGLIAWSFLGAILIITGAVAALLSYDSYKASDNFVEILSSAAKTLALGWFDTQATPTKEQLVDNAVRSQREIFKGTLVLGALCGLFVAKYSADEARSART